MDFMDFSYQGIVDRIRTFEMCRTWKQWPGSMGEATTRYPNLVAAFEVSSMGGVGAFARNLGVSYEIAVSVIEDSGELTFQEGQRIARLLGPLTMDVLFDSTLKHMSDMEEDFQECMAVQCERFEDISGKYHGITAWETSHAIYRAMKSGADIPYVQYMLLVQRINSDDNAYRDSCRRFNKAPVRNTRI